MSNEKEGGEHQDPPPFKTIAYSSAALATSAAVYVIFQIFFCGCPN